VLFHVNPSSGVPIYVQIENQVKNAVAAGALKKDQPIPSVRKLASDLGVNPNTVARAYQELEHGGVIRTVPGGGTSGARNALDGVQHQLYAHKNDNSISTCEHSCYSYTE